MAETKTLVTADELLRMPEDGYRYELVRGELIRMVPPGGEHGQYTNRLNGPLTVHVLANRLGVVFAAETGFRLEASPDTVRAPDISFVRRDRLPPPAERRGYLALAPDLAVETISPSESAEDIRDKLDDYFRTGVRLVWLLFPRRRTVEVWRADSSRTELREGDTLEGEDVVPGFAIQVAEIFADW